MALSPTSTARLSAGLVAIALAAAILSPEIAVYGFGGLASVALLWRAWRREPGWWIWLAVCASITLSGISSVLGPGPVEPAETTPAVWWSWAFYFAATATLVGAWAAAARVRGGRDPISLIDGLAVAAACAVPAWVAWVGPALDATQLSDEQVMAALVTPALYLVLIAVAVRTLLGGGTWALPAVLMMAGLAFNMIGDLGYNLMALHGDEDGAGPTDIGWVLAYACWAAAALHPQAPQSLRPGGARRGVRATRRVLVIVATATLPLATIAVAHIEATPVAPPVVLVPLGAMIALLLVRLAILHRKGARSLRGTALLASAGILALLVGLGLTQAQTASDRQRAAANNLLQARAESEAIGYFGSRVIGQAQDADPATIVRVTNWTANVRLLIGSIDAEANGVRRAELLALHDRWMAAAREVFAYVLAGRPDAAAAADRTDLTPAHTALVAALQDASARYREGAAADAKQGRIASVLVLVGSLIALCLLLARFGTTRRAALAAIARNEAIQESELRFRALIDGSPDVITVIDADSTILAHADTVERVLGYPEGTMQGKRLAELLPPAEGRGLQHVLRSLAARPGGTETLTGRVRVADGRVIDVEASIVNHVDNPHLGGYVVNARDVSDRKLLEAQLEHQALHDPLTGLPNRALLADRLRRELQTPMRGLHAMVLLDVNDFKAINDSFGHTVGDGLLIEVARRIETAIGAGDTAARVGGDEFAVLLDGVESPDQAVEVARGLVRALQSPVDLGNGHVQPIRSSVGVAVTDGGTGTAAQEAEHLLRNAELAMYEAKRAGGQGAVELFADEMHEVVAKRLELRTELERAIAEGELVLHYQPIVDLRRREICGYEALVRWIHPRRGMVSPGEFIPVAEESGLIVELGHWVLREACRQAAEWRGRWPRDRYVSVNVAEQQLQREAFVDEVIAAVGDAGLPPRLLLLEVTESGLIADSEGNERRLDRLRELGTRLAIDDFGTGYSSLSYLHRFPFDVLKIDKSFIDRVAAEQSGRALVEAMVRMAESLELQVVAEGIEDAAQADALAAMGCELGQGYHFSRPLPAAEVAGFGLPAPSAAART